MVRRSPGKAAAPSTPVETGHVRTYAFTTADELTALMGELDTVAFYSEMYFDRRLTRSGRCTFSMADIEMGVAGAGATLERLLSICRTPFYRVFGRHLGSPFAASAAHARGDA